MMNNRRVQQVEGSFRACRAVLLVLAILFFSLYFVHLSADFPHNSPWNDLSPYTDEGWYGDGAIRHFLIGHWYLRGDFNPAVAMPVWPLLEACVFRITGVSLAAARALAVAAFGVNLGALYWLMQRSATEVGTPGSRTLEPAVTVLLCCANPFFYAFDRLAILEPLLTSLAVMTLLVGSHLRPLPLAAESGQRLGRILLLQAVFGVLLVGLVLTKPSALAICPALLWLVWARMRFAPAITLRCLGLPCLLAITLWLGYLLLVVNPHYRADYSYLFQANAYTSFQLEPMWTVLLTTVASGASMGVGLYATCAAGLLLFVLFRPRFFLRPLVQTWLVWSAGYLLFLAYHNNPQPRYYLLLALPVTALVATMLGELLHAPPRVTHWPFPLRGLLVVSGVVLLVIPGAVRLIGYVLRPDYSFLRAARAVACIVRAHPAQPSLLLSVSGSDLSLMTGLPSINDDFGTATLAERVRQYRPGWYAGWNEIDDDKLDDLSTLYRPVRVGAFPVSEDPDRNLLILYRLDSSSSSNLPRQVHQRVRERTSKATVKQRMLQAAP